MNGQFAAKAYMPTCGMAEHCFSAFMGTLENAATAKGLEARSQQFAARHDVYGEGDVAREIYEIKSGMVMLYRLLCDGRRQIIEILGQGDIFGLAYGQTHDTSVETLTTTTLKVFDRKAAEQDPAMQRLIASATRRQLEAAHNHVLTLGRKTAQEKVASYLMRIQKASGESLNIALPMTRQEIADFLGLTIETVSRVISSFKRNGLVTNLCAERMQIADIETMESLANAW
jgi:CRP/FNR family transcriptional regulator